MKKLILVFVLTFAMVFSFSQEVKKEWGSGFRLVQQFNMPVLRTAFAYNINYGNHNFYVGPHYTHIIKNNGYEGMWASQNTYGLNFGYMVVIKTKNKTFHPLCQIDASVYDAKSTEVSYTKVFFETNFSIGLLMKISEKVDAFTGYGRGINGLTTYWNVTPHIYIGLHFKFKN